MILCRLLIRLARNSSLALGEVLQADGIRRDRVRDELSVDNKSSHVDVSHVITELVVAGVVPVAGLAAKHLLFLFGLDALSASRDTSSGNAVADEAVVVAAAVEGNESIVQTLLLVPVDVQVAQLLRTTRVQRIGSVIDLVGKVGAGHHVVIHEQADLLVFFFRE